MKKVFLITGLFWIAMCSQLPAQAVTDPIDELDIPADTAKFYKKLYDYSKNKKYLYILYKSIFNPPVYKSKVPRKKPVAEIPIDIYSGRVIRSISITSLEPFGTKLHDTTHVPHSVVQEGGNAIHVLTRESTIRNSLLFEENDCVDPLKIVESERLLRSTGYIRDARIAIKEVPGSADSIDIVLITQDYWTIRPYVVGSTSRFSYRLREKNLAGLGHELDVRLTDKLLESSPVIVDAGYRIPSFGKTYISSLVYYGSSDENNVRGISLNRPFYSPLTRVAGGFDVLSRAARGSTRIQNDTNYFDYSYESLVFDGWSGLSLRLLKGNTNEERSTRVITALRYARTRYAFTNTSDAVIDNYFAATDLYMGSISLASRKYVKDRYIFKFGEIEDVPDGRKISFTAGYEKTPQNDRYYFSAESSIGTYFPDHGYIYLSGGYGTFWNKHAMSQGLVSGSLIYVTPLYQAHRWRIRTFTTANLDYGIDRKFQEVIYLNADEGLPGYKNSLPQGTSRLAVSTQIIFYSPFEIIGFRFAPILLAGIGMMGDYNSSVLHSRVYQTYGIGLLIKNELLVFNTFQITVAWYPVSPTAGYEFHFNPVKLNEDRFHDFEITKPSVMGFE